MLLKAARRFDLGFDWRNRKFDFEKKPLQAIGHEVGATSLHAIIMGCQMGEDEKQEIRHLVKPHAPYIRLKRAVRVPHNYPLTLEDVTNADAPQDSAKAQNTTQARQEAPEDTRQI